MYQDNTNQAHMCARHIVYYTGGGGGGLR